MQNYTITISDAEKKALETDVVSIQVWLDNAIHSKARLCIDAVCKDVLERKDALTAADRASITAECNERGIFVTSPSALPLDIKESLVRSARVKSANERNLETDILEAR